MLEILVFLLDSIVLCVIFEASGIEKSITEFAAPELVELKIMQERKDEMIELNLSERYSYPTSVIGGCEL